MNFYEHQRAGPFTRQLFRQESEPNLGAPAGADPRFADGGYLEAVRSRYAGCQEIAVEQIPLTQSGEGKPIMDYGFEFAAAQYAPLRTRQIKV